MPPLSECKGCGEVIRFVDLDTGSTMPVNPMPNRDGRGTIAARLSGGRLTGFVISRDHRPGPFDSLRFTVHYATCEAVKRRKPAPGDRPLF